MSYDTYTATYTVVDIRKTFEGFEADLRMIARRTEKWNTEYVDKVFHDIIKLAEAKYLRSIDIILLNIYKTPIRAAKYTVNEGGNTISGERAGGNDWINLPNTTLQVLLNYTTSWNILSTTHQQQFESENNFKIGWIPSSIDNSFSHLTKQMAQLFASNGFELQKSNYK